VLLLKLYLPAQITDQNRPHLRIRTQQDLQILIAQKFDLAAHIHVQTLHFVEIVAHLRQVIIGLR